MKKGVALQPKDWVVFRDYSHGIFKGRSNEFVWRIGRITLVASGISIGVSLCAPLAPREVKSVDMEREPWNVPGIALPDFPVEYLICVHLRNRRSIAWLTESKPRLVERKDIILANNVADVEAVFSSKCGFS
ncbi:MAG: hypothetical protein WAU28_03690 [Candidatus Moraniibacteriota bacterium]